MITTKYLLAAVLGLVAGGILDAQEISPARPAPWKGTFGVTRHNGRIVAVAETYKAWFDAGSFTFVPSLGRGVARNHPTTMSLTSISRGTVSVAPLNLDADPVWLGNVVEYVRGDQIKECYEVRTDGVEQFFHLASRPGGSGELVIKQRITTDLLGAHGESIDGLELSIPGIGGISYGRVVVVDANGDRIGARTRFDGEHLEIRVCGDFLDRAAYPVVVDPLIGAEFQISPPIPPLYVPPLPIHEDPDVAHDATAGIYLVAWVRHNSATDRDIVAQRFSNAGSPVGGLLLIDSGALVAQPAVGNVNETNTFVVVWSKGLPSGGASLLARSVVAQAGGLSPSVVLAAGASFPYTIDNRSPRVGGEARLNLALGVFHTDAVVVWQEVGSFGSRIKACEVICAPLAVPVISTLPFYVSSGSTDSQPDITRHGGDTGHWLVTWDRAFTGHVGRDILARIIGNNGLLCTLETAVTFTTFSNEERPSVARKMQSPDFMIVFQQESSLNSGDFGIQCRGLSFNGSCFGGGSLTMMTPVTDLSAQPTLNEINPVVEFAQSKYMVVWAEENAAGNAHLRLRHLAPDNCAFCSPIWSMGTGSLDTRHPAIAAQNSSSMGGGDEALVVWDDAATGAIRGQRAAALGAGGALLPYAASCGGGGTCGVSGPSALGNLNFAVTLTGADPAAFQAHLALSLDTLNFQCGSCTLVPTLDFLFIQMPVTNGSATLPLPLPCHPALTGISIYAQWVVIGTTASPCSVAPNASLSSAVRIYIVP